MGLHIVQAQSDADQETIRQLFGEYMQWVYATLDREYGIRMDVSAMVEQQMQELAKFRPPQGRLLLALLDDQPAGVACLRKLDDAAGEIKRFYVRPAFRGRKIGRSLMERLIADARQIGYSALRLDSVKFMTEAQALYRSVGFRFIDAYPESKVPADFLQYWVFMELAL